MTQPQIFNAPFVNSVFHPSDFSEASENAFAHALALALVRETKFTIFHVGGSRQDWRKFPAVRTALERWGLLEKDSPKSAVFDQLSVRIKKVNKSGRNPLSTTLEYLEKHPTDLIVLATEGREGAPRWFQPSLAERLSVKSKTMTLFVPESARGFVTRETGEIHLNRILVPVDYHPSPLPAMEYSTRPAKVGGFDVEVTLLHVSDSTNMPGFDLPEVDKVTWNKVHMKGDVVEAITKTAEEISADVIMMSTAGHEGILDAIRGSVTQQVLRRASCPLLAVPVAYA